MTTITASSLRSGPSQLVAWQGNEYHYSVFAEVRSRHELIILFFSPIIQFPDSHRMSPLFSKYSRRNVITSITQNIVKE